MLDWVPSAPYTAEQLLEVLRILRDPENGCPWDKVQTHASIRKTFWRRPAKRWKPSTPTTRPCSGRNWAMC